MNCPKCGNPNAECIIGNYWKCPSCDNTESHKQADDYMSPGSLALLREMSRQDSSGPIGPGVTYRFSSRDPAARARDILLRVKDFLEAHGGWPSGVVLHPSDEQSIGARFIEQISFSACITVNARVPLGRFRVQP